MSKVSSEDIEKTLKTLDVLRLLNEMAPDLLRINPAAAETAALAWVRIRNKFSRLSLGQGLPGA